MKKALIGALVALAAAAGGAQAQPYPAKSIRIVVGFAPGGPSDIVARIVAAQLTERLGRQVVVENRPGATGIIGAELVAKSPPDGYSLYLASQTTHAVAPYMFAKLAYDPLKDFAPVTLVAHNPLLMTVHPSLGVKTFKEFLAKARASDLDFATGGIGSSPHMSMELLKSMTGIRMTPIHYKGDGAAVTELVGGQVPMMTASISGLLPYVKAGRLRGLAVTSANRSAIAPEFPTIAESGLPGFEVVTWFAILGTGGTSPDIVNRLHQEITQLLTVPAVKEQINKLGFEIVGQGPNELAAFLKSEVTRWGGMVKKLGLKGS